MKKKLLIVANVKWASWQNKTLNLKAFFASKVDLEIEVIETNFQNIPFKQGLITDIPLAFSVDPDWYNSHITSLALNHDIVLFVIPVYQWTGSNRARGVRTDRDQGPVELQIGADEHEGVWQGTTLLYKTFEHYASHEILHALFMITGQKDTTHYWDYEKKNLSGAVDELKFSIPNEDEVRGIAERLISLLTQAIDYFTKKEMPPEKKKKPTLIDLAKAIQVHEGWFEGSRSWRNKNPGNLKWVGQTGSIGQDKQGFALFRTEADGFAALVRMLTRAAQGQSKVYKPTMTLTEFFGTYAPSADHNNPDQYAQAVATKLGVPVIWTLLDFLV